MLILGRHDSFSKALGDQPPLKVDSVDQGLVANEVVLAEGVRRILLHSQDDRILKVKEVHVNIHLALPLVCEALR